MSQRRTSWFVYFPSFYSLADADVDAMVARAKLEYTTTSTHTRLLRDTARLEPIYLRGSATAAARCSCRRLQT